MGRVSALEQQHRGTTFLADAPTDQPQASHIQGEHEISAIA
jgi:hypothetical protein